VVPYTPMRYTCFSTSPYTRGSFRRQTLHCRVAGRTAFEHSGYSLPLHPLALGWKREAAMATVSPLIRVLFSSTFADFVLEREALQARVFPGCAPMTASRAPVSSPGMWDVQTGELVRVFDPKRGPAGSDNRALWLWDLQSGAWLSEWIADGRIRCFAVALQSGLVIVGDSTGALHRLRVDTGLVEEPLVSPRLAPPAPVSVPVPQHESVIQGEVYHAEKHSPGRLRDRRTWDTCSTHASCIRARERSCRGQSHTYRRSPWRKV
jgi:hypothetical protein